jgi:hypothetical protein
MAARVAEFLDGDWVKWLFEKTLSCVIFRHSSLNPVHAFPAQTV